MENTVERIKRIVAETLGLDEKTLTTDTNFKTGLNTDSLYLVEVMVAIEKEFGLSIPDEQVERIATVQQAVDYVNKTRVIAV